MTNSYKGHFKLSFTFLLLLISLSMLLLCRENNPTEKKLKRSSRKSIAPKEIVTVDNYDSLLTNLVQLENAVSQYPDSSELIGQLLKMSSLVKVGHLFVAGIGVVLDENVEPEIHQIEKERACRHSAKDWALYVKAHLNDSKITPRTKIAGKIMYSTTILEIERNDTLFQLVKMPVSSVVIW